MFRRILAIGAVGALGIMLGTIAAQPAGAQALRGVVRDSTSGLAIAGAVITLLDSAMAPAARIISNERGEFRIASVGSAARSVGVVRLGFRPARAPLPFPREGDVELSLTMVAIPMALQSVNVIAGANCPRRPDRDRALAVLEQARAGLLASIVSREQTPASMKRLQIRRFFDVTRDSVTHQIVGVDSVAELATAFGSAFAAPDFVRQGFVSDSAGTEFFHGPDEEVLLDDRFAAGYCFHIADATPARPNQIGVGFRAADRRDGRIDVDGALWIDTVARALVDIEFRYTGLARQFAEKKPGGHIEFREMPNGAVLIDRWVLRLTGTEGGKATESTTDPNFEPSRRGRQPIRAVRTTVSEFAGEIAHAAWPDGHSWNASLGAVSLTVTDSAGRPLTDRTVRLIGTDYYTRPDSLGRIHFTDLAPGPYRVSIIDSSLARIGLEQRTPLTFTATRGETKNLTLHPQPLDRYLEQVCKSLDSDYAGGAIVVGRVMNRQQMPLGGAVLTVRVTRDGRDRVAMRGIQLADHGVFAFCGGAIGDVTSLTIRRPGMRAETVTTELKQHTTIVPVAMVPDR